MDKFGKMKYCIKKQGVKESAYIIDHAGSKDNPELPIIIVPQ